MLLSELESVQKNARYAITWKDIKTISETSRAKRIAKFGNNARHLALGLCVKYIFEDAQLAQLLLLSKETHSLLRMPIYKQALLYSQPERLIGKRKSIWKCILKMHSNNRDYNAFKAKVKEDPSLIKNVEEVIVLDV